MKPQIYSVRVLFLVLLFWAMACIPVHADGIADKYPQVQGFFPAADHFGEQTGTPPAAPVYQGDMLLGYVFLSGNVVRIPAYSGRPINTLIGFDVSGRIVGISIVEHEEPILLVGITDQQLFRFADQYTGKFVHDRIVVGGTRAGYVTVDGISGATITVMVENATIMRSVRAVANVRGVVVSGAPKKQSTTATNTTATVTITKKAKPPPTVRVSANPEPLPSSGLTMEDPIWVMAWQDRVFRIGVLAVGLTVLGLILVFQDWLARHPTFLLYVRDGFLVYTLFFIGWYGLAQLSVVNVLTFAHAVFHDFQWQSFLIDPMMFILWSFVAVTLLLWGRGVYCGWLCPYGALQELVNQIGRKLKFRQLEFPDVVHERLWAVKYIILLVLFGISLQSLGEAERYAEVEPFKTAITLRFQREWGFVFFAAGMVLISLFNRKLYCKYLCPLGAALAIPGNFRIFDWLRRRKECGRPCQVCGIECEVQAIRPTGEINANECHYCLDCQVTYYNAYKCPPMVDKRKRQEKSVRARELVRGMEPVLGASGLDDIGVKVVPREHDRS